MLKIYEENNDFWRKDNFNMIRLLRKNKDLVHFILNTMIFIMMVLGVICSLLRK